MAARRMAARRFTYFLAHAGRDASSAEKLYDLLRAAGVEAFVDSRCLLPGDAWDLELRRAQRDSLATVALVSVPIDPAYYLRAEIAWAIAQQRHAPDEHRLIPVYLDGLPARPEDVPYGLEPLHALDASRGFADVVTRLVHTANVLHERAGRPAPVATQGAGGAVVSASEAVTIAPHEAVIALYDGLVRLIDAQFDVVVLYASAPQEFLPPRTAPLATRAMSLASWAQQGGAPRLMQLRAAIRRVAPDLC